MIKVRIAPDYEFQGKKQQLCGCMITVISIDTDVMDECLFLNDVKDILSLRDALTMFINNHSIEENGIIPCRVKKMHGESFLVDEKNNMYKLIEKGKE